MWAGPPGRSEQLAAERPAQHLVGSQRPHGDSAKGGAGQPAERAAGHAAHGELGEDRPADLAAGSADRAQQREPAPP